MAKRGAQAISALANQLEFDGDEIEVVLSGSINKQGVLEIRTTRHAGDSALSRILNLVENATENKT